MSSSSSSRSSCSSFSSSFFLLLLSFFSLVVVYVSCHTPLSPLPSPPAKPQWPPQFECIFGLYVPTSNITNSTAHFYYDFTIPATLIVYEELCIPVVPNTEAPCSFLFNSVGTYFIQPNANKTCCLLFPGVGVVPPDFLAGFTYANDTTALNYFGLVHQTHFWTGPGGFGYWTDIVTNHDIQFEDGGGSNIYWRFAPFTNVNNQTTPTFDLPTNLNNCSAACPPSLFSSEAHLDPYTKAALYHYNF